MKLTTKGRYAVTLLLDVTMLQKNGPVTVPGISSRHGLSPAYLERIAAQLRAYGLLKSVRGAQGGYLLARPAKEIHLAEVIGAVDERMDATQCHGQGNCRDGKVCLTHHVWDSLNQVILDYLKSISLEDLVQDPGIVHAAKEFYNLLPTPVLVEEQN
jgi:Rrf2 family iron-sulfur cluster assembly transcriptional regulator